MMRPTSTLVRTAEHGKTRALFAEIVHLINESLSNEATCISDPTIVTVLHLFTGELMMANESALRLHERGLWTMVSQRGGLDKLGGDGLIAAMVVMYVF